MTAGDMTSTPEFADPASYFEETKCLAALKSAMKADSDSQAKIVDAVCDMLDEMVDRNDCERKATLLTKYQGAKVLLKASQYLKRIIEYGHVSPSCVLAGIVYWERLQEIEPTAHLTSWTMQRMLLLPIMIACKYLEDRTCRNQVWATIASVEVSELNELELDLLFRLNFRLSLSRREYERRVARLLGSDTPRSVTSSAASASVSPRRTNETTDHFDSSTISESRTSSSLSTNDSEQPIPHRQATPSHPCAAAEPAGCACPETTRRTAPTQAKNLEGLVSRGSNTAAAATTASGNAGHSKARSGGGSFYSSTLACFRPAVTFNHSPSGCTQNVLSKDTSRSSSSSSRQLVSQIGEGAAANKAGTCQDPTSPLADSAARNVSAPPAGPSGPSPALTQPQQEPAAAAAPRAAGRLYVF